MFSERLSKERKRLGLTQADVADVLNIGRSAVAMYETGKANMDNKALAILADTLHFDVKFLITGQTDVTTNAKAIDWEMLMKISRAIRAGCLSKGIELPPEREEWVVKMLYEHFIDANEISPSLINNTLTLAMAA